MNYYLLFKSLHLISVISWMAGLLYLPRIFVYHSQNIDEIKTSEIFKVMERKLYFYIMTPAMFLSWLFGLLLIHSVGLEQLSQTWMVLKIVFLYYDTSHDSFMDIWIAFNSQHRISAIRSNMDGIKNNICDIPYFVSFLFRQNLKSV